jgi:hypothetical protein
MNFCVSTSSLDVEPVYISICSMLKKSITTDGIRTRDTGSTLEAVTNSSTSRHESPLRFKLQMSVLVTQL